MALEMRKVKTKRGPIIQPEAPVELALILLLRLLLLLGATLY